jgi:hypothetical protein
MWQYYQSQKQQQIQKLKSESHRSHKEYTSPGFNQSLFEEGT